MIFNSLQAILVCNQQFLFKLCSNVKLCYIFLVYHIIVMHIQYCQKWSRIGTQKKMGYNGGNLWAVEQQKRENWSRICIGLIEIDRY